MNLKKIIVSVTLVISGSLSAQNFIGISNAVTGFRDTVNINQSVSYKVYIKNYGPAVFNGYFSLNTWANSSNTPNNFHFSRLDTIFAPITISPGDSMLFNTGDTYDLATYRVTGNVVVIWPRTFQPGWDTKDSVFKEVYVLGATFIKDYEETAKHINLYPNPTSGVLNIESSASNLYIEDVRIKDINGKQIDVQHNFLSQFFIDELTSGTYFVECHTNKGVFHKRFLKI